MGEERLDSKVYEAKYRRKKEKGKSERNVDGRSEKGVWGKSRKWEDVRNREK